jgi:phosphoribosylpyrophosphate synthetase
MAKRIQNGHDPNRHGQLTLVSDWHHIEFAETVRKHIIELAMKMGDKTAIDIARPKFGYHVNGEPFVELTNEHINGHDCVVLTSGPGTPEMLTRLQILLAYLVARQAERITIISGYLPLTRSDKDEGDRIIKLSPIIIHLLNAAAYPKGLSRIIIADPHADPPSPSPGLVVPIFLTRRLLTQIMLDARRIHPSLPLCLLLPDSGAKKRQAGTIAEVQTMMAERQGIPHADLPLAVGGKIRLVSHDIERLEIEIGAENLKGRLVVILDDEISTGNTTRKTARLAVRDHGAKMCWAASTHAVLCKDAAQKLAAERSSLDRVYVTNTIPILDRPELSELLASGQLQVVPWTEDCAKVAYHHHAGMSIREIR